ncbi:DNA cytosine methyltransferase, partial [Streptomyces sp. SID89]|nr:DNA cytosine methyltransferase [Streptomyces sp. SID89]
MTQPTDIRRAPGSPPRLLALCAGYGGLETALRAGIGGQVAAYAESDPFAAAVFAAHHPRVPNLGDITAVDWHRVRDLYAPDVVGAGFPCRNISNAGRRDGIHGQWSRVWKNVAEAVGVLRPR